MTLPIFLIGPRGCGKTTIGHALARARHYQFTDTDHALQEREQRTVATIVEQEGWARFRELESEALKAAARPETVVATGGGIILAEANRQFMRENGVVIYLQVPVEFDQGDVPVAVGVDLVEELRRPGKFRIGFGARQAAVAVLVRGAETPLEDFLAEVVGQGLLCQRPCRKACQASEQVTHHVFR